MALNLELKIKVLSHAEVLTSLKKIGAHYIGVLKQKDVYFNNGKKLLKLRIQPEKMELIKYNRDETGTDRFCNYEILCLKGKKDFFNEIFNIECIVSKRRELWMYDNTRIHLDTVKKLGRFIELETLVIGGRIDAKKRFNKIVQLLNLDPDKQIKTSYRNLLLK